MKAPFVRSTNFEIELQFAKLAIKKTISIIKNLNLRLIKFTFDYCAIIPTLEELKTFAKYNAITSENKI